MLWDIGDIAYPQRGVVSLQIGQNIHRSGNIYVVNLFKKSSKPSQSSVFIKNGDFIFFPGMTESKLASGEGFYINYNFSKMLVKEEKTFLGQFSIDHLLLFFFFKLILFDKKLSNLEINQI